MTHTLSLGDSLEITIDPLKAYTHRSAQALIEACGVLLPWASEAAILQAPFYAHFEEVYPYGLHKMTGGTVDKTGLYEYPGDPPLSPVIQVSSPSEICFLYPSAIVAIYNKQSGDSFVTKVD